MLQTEPGRASCQSGPGQQCQGKDVEMVGIQPQGIVEAGTETVQGIARQSVNQVKTEGGTALVQQRNFLGERPGFKSAPHPLEHDRLGALESDL